VRLTSVDVCPIPTHPSHDAASTSPGHADPVRFLLMRMNGSRPVWVPVRVSGLRLRLRLRLICMHEPNPPPPAPLHRHGHGHGHGHGAPNPDHIRGWLRGSLPRHRSACRGPFIIPLPGFLCFLSGSIPSVSYVSRGGDLLIVCQSLPPCVVFGVAVWCAPFPFPFLGWTR
jgi:hypothetical protein